MLRTKSHVASFRRPFSLPGFDDLLPAGDYRIDQDEELIEGLSQIAWRRVDAFIHVPAIGTRASTFQMVPVSGADLEAAIEKDQSDDVAQDI